jgi:hypothetical protein
MTKKPPQPSWTVYRDYSNAVAKDGPNSPICKELREIWSYDAEFIEYADAADQLKTKLANKAKESSGGI